MKFGLCGPYVVHACCRPYFLYCGAENVFYLVSGTPQVSGYPLVTLEIQLVVIMFFVCLNYLLFEQSIIQFMNYMLAFKEKSN